MNPPKKKKTTKKKPAASQIPPPPPGWAAVNNDVYALPIAPQPPMIRLRLPSEKPTRGDANKDGNIFVIFSHKVSSSDYTNCCPYTWDTPFEGDELAWFSLPDGILAAKKGGAE